MSRPIQLKKDDQVICTHYKDRPACTVLDIRGAEIWVREHEKRLIWQGPRSWFRKLPE